MSAADPIPGPVLTGPGHDPDGGADVFVFPMSFAQQRLWFIDRLQPNSWSYNLAHALRLEGNLDAVALRKSIDEIARRHEILRTTFDLVDEVPSQLIGPFQPADWEVLDLEKAPRQEALDAARDYIHDQAHTPFDLARGPLFRARLIRLGEREHILLTTKHHIISDAWSEGIFIHELSLLYGGFLTGTPPALPELPIQYADFAEWQRQNLETSAVQAQLAYWKKKLAGPLPQLRLPGSAPRPAIQTSRGGVEPVFIPASTAASLRKIAQENGATLFMLLLAAYNVLLARYSGAEDIAVGTPIANRNRSETERLIGFFLNMLVLRTDLSGNPRFTEALARVRETALGGYQNPDIPFEMLVDELQPERNLSQNPLCQVMFVLQNQAAPLANLSGLKSAPVEIESTTAKFDLTLDLAEENGAVTGSLVYNADLFRASDMKRMAARFLRLVESIAANPDSPICDLSLFGAEERQLLAGWNQTARPFPETAAVPALFAEQAARTPESVAVQYSGEKITYAALDRGANQLAARLVQLGVRPGDPVAVCLDRSAGMIVAFLAILKAGAAYLPIDPAYPRERIAWMLKDASARIVLSETLILQPLLAGNNPWQAMNGSAPRFIDLRAEAAAIENLSPEPLPAPAGGDALAALFYTSGSTGTPKAVAIPHRAIVRLVVNTNYVQLGAGDVIGQVSNCCFDAATFEIWGALLNGASLAGVSKEVLLSPRDFLAHVETHRINTLFLTTALFNHFVREVPALFPRLRYLLFGGEAVDVTSVAACLRQGAPRHLLHVYGPTETATFATFHEVTEVPPGASTVPIGKPIANTTLHLLDSMGRPVAAGMEGEIHIGGPGLALGYWNRPDLTAERFVTRVLDGGAEERLYRTGDIGRFLEDGAVEFVGRVDDQVKIRGFRIEPGEVEAVLSRHPDVAAVSILAREEARGEKMLVAYVVARECSGLTVPALQQFLRGKLPDYMLPSDIVFLARMPLNANGKVDRAALPAPAREGDRGAESFAGPRDEIEEQLIEIWERSLNRRHVGIHDNFFDSGGHSLLAVGLFAQIERKMSKNLPLATLFDAPTVAQLAGLIRDKKSGPQWASLVPIQPLGDHPPFFCVHGGDGGVLFYSELGRHLAPDQPFYGVQAQGLDGRRIEHSSTQEMSAYYLRELRQVQPEGPYYLGGYSFGGIIAMEMAQQLLASGQKVAFLALFDTNNPAHPPRRFTLRERIALRQRDMTGLKTPQKFRYLLHRAVGKALVVFNQKKENLRKRLHRRALDESPVIPTALRNLHVREKSTEAFLSYKPKPFSAPLVVFRADNPPDGYAYDPDLGWRDVATGGLQVINAAGAHETIFTEPNVRTLAVKLRDCLARARAEVRVPHSVKR